MTELEMAEEPLAERLRDDRVWQLFAASWAPDRNEKVLVDRCLDAVREFDKHVARRARLTASTEME